MEILKLTRAEVPDRSRIALFSDVHFPHADVPALKIFIEICEDWGVTHTIGNGDIFDCGPASRHEGKKAEAVITEGTLRESVATGEWFWKWLRTRRCIYGRGNHEGWVDQLIAKSPELHGTDPMELMGLPGNDGRWTVLPPKYRIKIGSWNIEHGDGFFPSGSGGQSPWTRIRSLAPDQTTSIGHLHRRFFVPWTTLDSNGIACERAAKGNGHVSLPEAHEGYAGSYTSWQQSIELAEVHYVDGKPRFEFLQPMIHRDKRGRPFCLFGGKEYR